MRNWLGQKIAVGDVVGRGARDGNSSSFKLGVVDAIDDKGVRVHWLYEKCVRWVRDSRLDSKDLGRAIVVPCRLDVKGRPDIDSLFRLTWDMKDNCDVLCSLYELYREGKLSGEEVVDRLAEF